MNAIFCYPIMKWSDFIEQLSRDFRLSEAEIASTTGMTYPTINRIRRGITEKPNQNTIKRLEEGLKIKIDDSDPENITYQKNSNPKGENVFENTLPLNTYPVFNYIYAGVPDMLLNEPAAEYISVPYNKKECFGIKVIGDSMNGVVSQGDIAFVDMTIDLSDGCIVAVRLRNGGQIIKRYHRMNNDMIILTSDNSAYAPVTYHLKDVEAMYRVVMILKNV